MIVKRLYTPGLSINSYLVYDEVSRKGAIIDPTCATNGIIAAASQENIIITDIIETHVHADFLSGSKRLKMALSGAPTIHCSGAGGKDWIPSYADRIVNDGDSVIIGNEAIRLQAIHTPGHTPEHLMWMLFDEKRSKMVPEILFSGDLLFVGSVGRPDLLGDKAEADLAKQLYRSLFDTLARLPPHIEVLPAHGAGSPCGKEIATSPTTTLGYEQATNALMKENPFQTWYQSLMSDAPGVPQYFSLMKKINLTGDPLEATKETKRSIDLAEAASLAQSHTIVDLRPYEAFCHKHLKDSLNIPLHPSFPLWAGTVLDPKEKIILLSDTAQGALKAMELLELIGYEGRVVATCLWDERAVDASTASELPLVEPEVFLKNNSYIIDVRSPTEWKMRHIPHAHSIELTYLYKHLDTIPRDQPLTLICRSGSRASIAASFLRKQGFHEVHNAHGGMMRVKD